MVIAVKEAIVTGLGLINFMVMTNLVVFAIVVVTWVSLVNLKVNQSSTVVAITE